MSLSPPPPSTSHRIAIIGGGLSGLAAAHRLIELSKSSATPIQVTLFEAGSRPGGIVGTQHVGDYLVDTGADSFLTNKPGAIGLCRRLGIEDKLVATDARFRGAHVLFDGRPVPVPEGFQLISPTAIWPILTTPILSPWGKLRLLMEYFVPPREAVPAPCSFPQPSTLNPQPFADESLADFVRRRLGREVLDRLVQPLVGGIYTSDPEHLSLAATLPRFLEMEREYGSLIRAALFPKKQIADRGSSAGDESNDTKSGGARYGLFSGLAGGMEDLITALRSRVEAGCSVSLGTRVTSIQRETTRPTGYQLLLFNGSRQSFDSVIVATTAHHAAAMLDGLDATLSHELLGIKYASSAIVVTGHKLADIRHPLDSFGLVVPHRERRRILATSFSSRKFPERAPAGSVLMRTFVGGAMQPELLELADDELLRLVQAELSDIFGVQGDLQIALVIRYPSAMPQYHVGHLDRVARIEALTGRHQGLALAGNAYR
ncbi:MAG: protoporphyrinogen oxidase, partial [Candidatus Saccharimonas sp.]|nr:protoporphyrinogen oxidase [Planctomycetaceae bacterium]